MDMIERVARAIESVKLIGRYNDWTLDRVEGLPIEILMDDPDGVAGEGAIVARFAGPERDCSKRRDEVLRILRARAAIEAMRIPTTSMEDAVAKDVDDWISEKIEDMMHLYKVAIDAALKEHEGAKG